MAGAAVEEWAWFQLLPSVPVLEMRSLEGPLVRLAPRSASAAAPEAAAAATAAAAAEAAMSLGLGECGPRPCSDTLRALLTLRIGGSRGEGAPSRSYRKGVKKE